jgi:flagellar protein FliO/FliZ
MKSRLMNIKPNCGYVLTLLFALPPSLVSAQDSVAGVGSQVAGNMDAMSMVLSLLMVLALIVASAYLLKHFNLMPQQNSALKLVTSLALSNKEKVVVLQVADKQLLLGVTAQQITLLDTLEQPIVVNKAVTTDMSQSLVKWLKKRELNQHD